MLLHGWKWPRAQSLRTMAAGLVVHSSEAGGEARCALEVHPGGRKAAVGRWGADLQQCTVA
jgi:hypothetical protein